MTRPQLKPVIERFEQYRGMRANRMRATAEKVAFRRRVPPNPVLAHRPLQREARPAVVPRPKSKRSDVLIPMAWPEVEELRDAGWEIGSHTKSYPKLTEVSGGRLVAEFGESGRKCEQVFGACASTAYPYADHNDDPRAFRLKVSPLVRRGRGSAAWPLVAGTLRSLKRRMTG